MIIHANLGLATGLSTAFFAVLATRLGASPWVLALIISAPYVADLLAPFWVSQARNWGVRELSIGSLVGAAIVLLFLGVARYPLTFALFVLLYYFFYGANDPLYMALAEVIHPDRIGSCIGRVQAVLAAYML